MVSSSLLNQIEGLRYGFGTRDEPVPTSLLPDWEVRPQWKQVHGIALATVQTPRQFCGEVDALATFRPHLPIAIATADCVPILLVRDDGRAGVAIHAGWRGTIQRVVEKTWEALRTGGEKPRQWMAAIGPSIGPCCYEVDLALMGKFRGEFEDDADLFAPSANRQLDLRTLNLRLLQRLGIERSEIVGPCTRCSADPKFYSFRGGDLILRQWSGLILGK